MLFRLVSAMSDGRRLDVANVTTYTEDRHGTGVVLVLRTEARYMYIPICSDHELQNNGADDGGNCHSERSQTRGPFMQDFWKRPRWAMVLWARRT